MNTTGLVRTIRGHADGVLALAYSPCGKFLATAGEDNTIRLWDSVDGIEIKTIEAHGGDVRALAFDPEGDLFASASWDKTVKIWQTSDCAEIAAASPHGAAVNCLAFSPDGRLLYSGSDDAFIKVLDCPRGAVVRTLKPDMGGIKALAVSAAGLIAAGGIKLMLMDPDGKVLRENDDYLHGVRGLAFSQDGRALALASGMEKRFEVWNTETLQRTFGVKDSDWVNCVAFTPDGWQVATGGGSAVKVWDPATGSCLKTFEGHADEIYAVDVSPDGKFIASASNDKTVKIWAL